MQDGSERDPSEPVQGGSYGAGGGYRQGGYERGNFDPALDGRARRTGYQAKHRQPQPRAFGGTSSHDSLEADFERGDWEGSGEWHGGATEYGRGGRPGNRNQSQPSQGGFAPEGSWNGGGDNDDGWRGTGEWGHRGGPMRGSAEWYRTGGDRGRNPQPWDVPGPHTGRGPDGYRRSEEAIRDDVCERLTRHGSLDATGISVRVEQGEVILEGTVESRQAKRMAEDAAESVSGVKDVQNRLRVGS